MNRKNENNQRNHNKPKKQKKGLFGRKENRQNNEQNNNVNESTWNIPINTKSQHRNLSENKHSNTRPNTSRENVRGVNQNGNANRNLKLNDTQRTFDGESSTKNRNHENRNLDNRNKDNRNKDNRSLENRSLDNRSKDNRSSENLNSNNREPVRSEEQNKNTRNHTQQNLNKVRKAENDRRSQQAREFNEQYKKLRVYKQEDLIGKRNNNNNARRTQFYVLLTAFIIIIYFGSNIYRMVANDGIDDMQIEKTVVDTPKIYEGIILRDEVLTKAKIDGEVEYKVANHEKAKVNQLVAQIVTGDEITQNIDISSEEFTAANKGNNADIENINSRIKSEFSYDKIQDYSQAYIYAEKIYESLEIRNQMILSEMDASAVNSESSTVKESLYTAVSGIVSYDLDNYEEVYTLDKIDDITPDDIKTVTKSNTSVRSKLVAKDDIVFKVLTDNSWYIVAYIDNDEIKSRGIEVGTNYEIYANKANTYVPIMSYIESIVEGKDTSKVVFKCDSYTIDYADKRSVSFKLAKDNIEGYKVPKTAIKQKEAIVINNDFIFFNEEKGYDYVMKKGYDGETYEVPITKYKTENVNTYVLKSDTELNKGDLLVNDKETYQIPDIYTINGVYLLNTGVVTFKEVTLYDGALDDENVVFLEASMNQNVRIHDTIATNVDEISEDEIIY